MFLSRATTRCRVDGGACGSGIRRQEGEEQARGFGAGREGVELGRDLGHELGDHPGDEGAARRGGDGAIGVVLLGLVVVA
ncbi:hypothetical protein TCAP_07356 [Tolypocladium capitatum]|uniref:Uncharacterized protein n=1 Tax=Tolypocladium capitatum TaxID=45235 RepID=A0A2K3PZF3_9HYPO|nr:hypothetical protein TCAP_07356 [Tolypocladium capitatum]